jgi:predicted metal-dependent enzyme (double-stranded beta helix superfamily)
MARAPRSDRDFGAAGLRASRSGRALDAAELRASRSGRALDAAELRALVTTIAADTARWGPLVRRDTRDRHFEELYCDEHVGVWVISWASGNDTGFHDHDVSCGAVAVVEGEVIEERLVVGGAPRELRHSAGETFDFDASHVHRMRHDADAPAVSIHAYSPPLSRMGAYAVEPDGTLRRRSISYEEELRPVEIAAW